MVQVTTELCSQTTETQMEQSMWDNCTWQIARSQSSSYSTLVVTIWPLLAVYVRRSMLRKPAHKELKLPAKRVNPS